jgi:hypothetical protein
MAYLIGQYVMSYGTNRARFGLFFSDMVDSSINTRSYETRSIFDANSKKFDKKNELYNNPFLTALLVKPETIDEIERKWAKSYQTPHVIGEDDDLDDLDDDTMSFSMFKGSRNEYGVAVADDDSFFHLISVPAKDFDEDDGMYGSHSINFYDDPDDGFF